MLKFLKLQIEGFCSIPELSLQLDQHKIIWIRAANGYGKSTIFNALVWVLYGKTLKGRTDVQTWKNVRPKDYKGTKVDLFFQKDNQVYNVTRCQNYENKLEDDVKGKDRLIFGGESLDLKLKSKTETQQAIIKTLGMSYSLFVNSIMFGQGIQRLIQETNVDKKKLFEEIFDLNYLNVARDIAINDNNEAIDQYYSLEFEYTRISNSLDSAKSTYRNLKDQERDFTQKKEERRKNLMGIRTKIKKRLENIEIGESHQEKIRQIKDKLYQIKKEKEEANKISKVSLEEFINDIYEMLQAKKYEKASKSLLVIKEAFSRISQMDKQYDKYFTKLSKYEDLERDYLTKSREKSSIEKDIERINSQLKDLEASQLKILSPRYKEQIKVLKEKLKKVEQEMKPLKDKLDNYKWLINDPLGNNGIKAYLFDSSLELLNNTLDNYSNTLGFRISFEINLDSSRKEFVTLIEREGNIIEYEELSGGEKQLVDISMAFAMNEALTASKGINVAFLDELFESLSPDNIEKVIELTKQVYQDKTLFIISHHDNLPFNNVKIMEIEKRNGLSYYKDYR